MCFLYFPIPGLQGKCNGFNHIGSILGVWFSPEHPDLQK